MHDLGAAGWRLCAPAPKHLTLATEAGIITGHAVQCRSSAWDGRQPFQADRVAMAGLRRKARILALQTLFEVDLAKHDPERALDYLLEDATVASEGSDFARQLVKGVLEHRPQIDDLIHEAAPTWPLEQMRASTRTFCAWRSMRFYSTPAYR